VADPVSISLGPYLLQVATDFGPRIVGFRRDGGPDLMAVLGPGVVIDRPDSGIYRFRGGHRLWAAPEVPSITYAPDDEPCEISTGSENASVVGPPDRAGLVKRIDLSHSDDGPLVDHVLTNAGSEPIQVAPWAITQLRLGGTAIIPIDGKADPDRLQAHASLALWPYTDLGDPRVTWHEGALMVRAQAGPAFKIGTGPDPGRLGYLLDGHLFTKTVEPAREGGYPDRGAVGQFYLGDAFCELETVGPLVNLQPEEETSHREVWAMGACDDQDAAWAVVSEGGR
jgi:hypothetical protein